jgi:hypothetical protein
MLSYTPFSVKYIENDIKDYLCASNTIGRTIAPKKLSIKVEANDYKPAKYDFDITNFSRFAVLNPVNLFTTLKGLTPGFSKKSFIEITYSYKSPRILKIIGNYKNKNNCTCVGFVRYGKCWIFAEAKIKSEG